MSFKHTTRTDDELRQIAIDVYDCKAFTSLQCRGHEITSCFPLLMFLLSPPSPPTKPQKKSSPDIKIERKNKLNQLDDVLQWEKDMEHYNKVTLPDWKKNEEPQIEAFVNDIGMVFEYYGKEAPLAVNGKPMFWSCQFLSKEDTQRFIEIYQRYEQRRAEFDKEAF